MTDIIKRLRGLDRDAYDWFAVVDKAADEIERLRAEVSWPRLQEATAEIERLRNDYSILKRDYDALRAEVEPLRTTLGYLADNIDNPALVAVAEAALKSKP